MAKSCGSDSYSAEQRVHLSLGPCWRRSQDRSETPHLLRLRSLVQIPVPRLHAYGPATGGVGIRVVQWLAATIFRHHHRLVSQVTLRGPRRWTQIKAGGPGLATVGQKKSCNYGVTELQEQEMRGKVEREGKERCVWQCSVGSGDWRHMVSCAVCSGTAISHQRTQPQALTAFSTNSVRSDPHKASLWLTLSLPPTRHTPPPVVSSRFRYTVDLFLMYSQQKYWVFTQSPFLS